MEILMQRAFLYIAIFCTLIIGPVGNVAAQENEIGVTAMVNNIVTGTAQGKIRRLNIRDRIFFNESIRTGQQGRTQFLFLDETILTMGPDSELKLDSMVYDPASGTGEMIVSITEGVFRFVSGTMLSESYKFSTPTSLIGIRGTIFDLIVDAEGQTSVIVEEGEVSMTVIQTGQSVTVPTGQSATISANAAQPTKPAPPTPAIVQQVKTALALTETETVAVPETITTETEDTASTEVPVDTQIISESADLVGQPGSQGSHSTP